MPSASEQLADEFIVLPYPFVGKERDAIEAEFSILLTSGIKPSEIVDLILNALEILITKRKETKDTNTFDGATSQISDMLGRLLVFEEMFSTKKHRKLK
jgi:hypothetical protein